jgi:hypothetical protein
MAEVVGGGGGGMTMAAVTVGYRTGTDEDGLVGHKRKPFGPLMLSLGGSKWVP